MARDNLDRRTEYREEAKRMTERELMETTFIEMRDLNHHVRVDVNGKVFAMWSWFQWGTLTLKIIGVVGLLAGITFGAIKAF